MFNYFRHPASTMGQFERQQQMRDVVYKAADVIDETVTKTPADESKPKLTDAELLQIAANGKAQVYKAGTAHHEFATDYMLRTNAPNDDVLNSLFHATQTEINDYTAQMIEDAKDGFILTSVLAASPEETADECKQTYDKACMKDCVATMCSRVDAPKFALNMFSSMATGPQVELPVSAMIGVASAISKLSPHEFPFTGGGANKPLFTPQQSAQIAKKMNRGFKLHEIPMSMIQETTGPFQFIDYDGAAFTGAVEKAMKRTALDAAIDSEGQSFNAEEILIRDLELDSEQREKAKEFIAQQLDDKIESAPTDAKRAHLEGIKSQIGQYGYDDIEKTAHLLGDGAKDALVSHLLEGVTQTLANSPSNEKPDILTDMYQSPDVIPEVGATSLPASEDDRYDAIEKAASIARGVGGKEEIEKHLVKEGQNPVAQRPKIQGSSLLASAAKTINQQSKFRTKMSVMKIPEVMRGTNIETVMKALDSSLMSNDDGSTPDVVSYLKAALDGIDPSSEDSITEKLTKIKSNLPSVDCDGNEHVTSLVDAIKCGSDFGKVCKSLSENDELYDEIKKTSGYENN
jgi:hypothetical protein